MTDRDAYASTLAARFTASGITGEASHARAADALATIQDRLNAASGNAVREAWWRRGGELFEPVLLAARRAPHPIPLEAEQVRRSLIATGRAEVTRWTFAPVDSAGALSAVDRAEAKIAADHPMVEEVSTYLTEVRQGWQQLRALHDGLLTDTELAQVWSARWRLPDSGELASAHQVVNRPTVVFLEGPVPRPSAVLARFAAALALAAPGWTVEERRQSAAIASVSPERRVVNIDPTRVDNEHALERLVVHEVLGHAARAHRASKRADMLSSVALGADAPETEEAMAMLAEREHEVSHPIIERRYAARLIGVAVASVAGIDEVYAELLRWLSPLEAAAIAVRVKRGISCPGRAGAYSKDVVYRRGGATLERYLAAYPDDLPVLRATKWGFSVVRRFGGLLLETGGRL